MPSPVRRGRRQRRTDHAISIDRNPAVDRLCDAVIHQRGMQAPRLHAEERQTQFVQQPKRLRSVAAIDALDDHHLLARQR